MCDADSTLITYNWLSNHTSPHPNFNVEHECRNYESLIEMARMDGVDSSMIPRRKDVPVEDLFEFSEPPFDPTADH